MACDSPGVQGRRLPVALGKTGQREAGLGAGAPAQQGALQHHGTEMLSASFSFSFQPGLNSHNATTNLSAGKRCQGAVQGQQHPGQVPDKVTVQAELAPTATPTFPPAPGRVSELAPCVVLGWGSGHRRALTLNPVGACAPARQDNPPSPVPPGSRAEG